MELIRISEEKLKIMLTASDMTAYDLDPDSLGDGTARTGRAFRLLLAEVRRQIPFETDGKHLTVQYFPSRGGGCEMFISRVPSSSGERGKKADARQAGALPVRAGRQTAAFRRDGAYRFPDLGCLLRACHRLRAVGYSGESAAYRDDAGYYYILLTVASPSPFSMPELFSFLPEYGEVQDPARLRVWLCEHGALICPFGAVSTLGALV